MESYHVLVRKKTSVKLVSFYLNKLSSSFTIDSLYKAQMMNPNFLLDYPFKNHTLKLIEKKIKNTKLTQK